MSDQDPHDAAAKADEFERLTAALCDGRIDAAGIERIEQLATADAALMNRLLQALNLDAHLRQSTRGTMGAEQVTEQAAAQAASDKRQAAEEQGFGVRVQGSSVEQTAASSGAGHQTTASRLNPRKLGGGSSLHAIRSFVRHHNLAVAVAVAFVAVGAIVAWMAFSYLPGVANDDDQPTAETDDQVIAWLVNAHNVEWSDGGVPASTRYKPGTRLAFQKGLVTIRYATGAEVVIEGPAEFVVAALPAERARRGGEGGSLDLANSGYLRLGRLVARCETSRSKGFAIDTPNARVVDLGTEFGVNVDETSKTRVAVLSGSIELVRESSPGVVAERVRLGKDQVALVQSGSSARIVRLDEGDVQLVNQMRERLDHVFETSPIVLPDSKLLAHWKFDAGAGATASDSSGNGFAIDQSVAAGSWVAGKTGGAYRLPRFALGLRQSNILALGGRPAVTLSAWVTASTVKSYQGVAGFENKNNDQDIYSLKIDNADKIVWTVDGSSSIISPKTLADYAAATDDGWVHLAGVFEQGQASTLYVNGAPVATGSAARPIQDEESLFAIGSYQGTSSYAFGGSIDDVQVYRGALSPADIEFLMKHPGSTIAARDRLAPEPNTDESTEQSEEPVAASRIGAGVQQDNIADE